MLNIQCLLCYTANIALSKIFFFVIFSLNIKPESLTKTTQDQKEEKKFFFYNIFVTKSNLTWTHYVVKYDQNWHEVIYGLDLFYFISLIYFFCINTDILGFILLTQVWEGVSSKYKYVPLWNEKKNEFWKHTTSGPPKVLGKGIWME